MKIFLFALFTIPLLAAGCYTQTSLKQSCPDEWISNQMPGISGDKIPNEYFIVNRKRAELSDYDVSWIEKNCKLQKQVVE